MASAIAGSAAAWRAASSMAAGVGSIPTTCAPRRARLSESSPPPHPTSMTRRFFKGLPGCRGMSQVIVGATTSLMYLTRTGFKACKRPAPDVLAGSHQLRAAASNLRDSLATTSSEEENDSAYPVRGRTRILDVMPRRFRKGMLPLRQRQLSGCMVSPPPLLLLLLQYYVVYLEFIGLVFSGQNLGMRLFSSFKITKISLLYDHTSTNWKA